MVPDDKKDYQTFFKSLAKQLEKLKREDPEAFKEVNKKAKKIAESLNEASFVDETLSVEEMRERELSDEEFTPPSFDPRESEEIESSYQLLLRRVEFMQGHFFWKCLIFAGKTYKPIFNKTLFDPPRVD